MSAELFSRDKFNAVAIAAIKDGHYDVFYSLMPSSYITKEQDGRTTLLPEFARVFHNFNKLVILSALKAMLEKLLTGNIFPSIGKAYFEGYLKEELNKLVHDAIKQSLSPFWQEYGGYVQMTVDREEQDYTKHFGNLLPYVVEGVSAYFKNSAEGPTRVDQTKEFIAWIDKEITITKRTLTADTHTLLDKKLEAAKAKVEWWRAQFKMTAQQLKDKGIPVEWKEKHKATITEMIEAVDNAKVSPDASEFLVVAIRRKDVVFAHYILSCGGDCQIPTDVQLFASQTNKSPGAELITQLNLTPEDADLLEIRRLMIFYKRLASKKPRLLDNNHSDVAVKNTMSQMLMENIAKFIKEPPPSTAGILNLWGFITNTPGHHPNSVLTACVTIDTMCENALLTSAKNEDVARELQTHLNKPEHGFLSDLTASHRSFLSFISTALIQVGYTLTRAVRTEYSGDQANNMLGYIITPTQLQQSAQQTIQSSVRVLERYLPQFKLPAPAVAETHSQGCVLQ
jgi:hypothetical protein